MKKSTLIILFLLLAFINHSFSQGDGARMLLWGPTGATSAIPKWMNLNQNMTPANILVDGAELHINAFPITVVHNFGIGGKFAQVMVNAVPGNVSGSLFTPPSGTSIPTNVSINSCLLYTSPSPRDQA